MPNKTLTLVAGLLSVLFLVLIVSQTESKSLGRSKQKRVVDSNDDLLAMPSNEYRQVVYEHVEQQYAPTEPTSSNEEAQPHEEIIYVNEDGQPVEMEQTHQQPSEHGQDETHQQQPSYQTTGSQQNQNDDNLATEVLYADQNGNLFRQKGDHYEPAAATTTLVSDSEQSDHQSQAERQSQQSNDSPSPPAMTATILTEVPLKDLSHQVLEQLKKDYGAKIVATREYPGAELIINCGDNSGSDVSICSKPKQQQQQHGSNYLSYPLISPANEENSGLEEHSASTVSPVNLEEKSEHAPETFTQEPMTETYEPTESSENTEGYGFRETSSGEPPEVSASNQASSTTKQEAQQTESDHKENQPNAEQSSETSSVDKTEQDMSTQ